MSVAGVLVLYADGASRGNPGASAIGVVAMDDSGAVVSKLSEYIGEATNNQAEYRAVIAALELAQKLGAKHIALNIDSELVAKQLSGRYRVRNAKLKPLFSRASRLLEDFSSFTVTHLPRGENNKAHRLAQQGLKGRVPSFR
jgi:ribonuclease HI